MRCQVLIVDFEIDRIEDDKINTKGNERRKVSR